MKWKNKQMTFWTHKLSCRHTVRKTKDIVLGFLNRRINSMYWSLFHSYNCNFMSKLCRKCAPTGAQCDALTACASWFPSVNRSKLEGRDLEVMACAQIFSWKQQQEKTLCTVRSWNSAERLSRVLAYLLPSWIRDCEYNFICINDSFPISTNHTPSSHVFRLLSCIGHCDYLQEDASVHSSLNNMNS